MPRAVRPWFRFYVEAFGDRKLRRLTPAQRWVWAAVLGAARESPEPGVLLIAEGLPMTIAELASYADVKHREVVVALDAMKSMGMLSVENDRITVVNWGSRQYESDDVTARTRTHRERSKERSNDVPGNVGRNTPETETETETEIPSSETRAEVVELCQRLADRIEANGSKRPSVGARWLTAARLMLDSDGRTVEQVEKAIDWCQSDEFWRSNILSMPKLREKYDQLRLAARRATDPPGLHVVAPNAMDRLSGVRP